MKRGRMLGIQPNGELYSESSRGGKAGVADTKVSIQQTMLPTCKTRHDHHNTLMCAIVAKRWPKRAVGSPTALAARESSRAA